MESKYLSSTRRIKVNASALEVGMFICDLDRPWVDSPFLLQGFLLENPNDIETVQQVCDYVYVDTSKSTLKESTKPSQKARRQINPPFKASFEETFNHASGAYDRTHALVKSTMDNIRLGNAIDTQAAKSAVKECVNTILDNPNTMVLLTQLKNKDEYTSQHSLNVCILSIVFGRFMGLNTVKLEELGLCGLLHDMGKAKIPIEILNKEDRLNPDELEIMKAHTTLGREILMSARGVPPSTVDVAYSHHERIDGAGYPRGLKSESITTFAKIVAAVDTYDAITSDRVYQRGRSHLVGLNILTKSRGTHFPSSLIINFIACIGVYPPGSIIEFQNGEVGIVFEVTSETKTKPKVLLVLDQNKRPRKEAVLDLAKQTHDENGQAYKIKEVLRQKAFGIDIKAFIERGLVLKGSSEQAIATV